MTRTSLTGSSVVGAALVLTTAILSRFGGATGIHRPAACKACCGAHVFETIPHLAPNWGERLKTNIFSVQRFAYPITSVLHEVGYLTGWYCSTAVQAAAFVLNSN